MGIITLGSDQEELIRLITQKVSDIPMLPSVVIRLLGLVSDDDHSLQDVVKLVETDSALTARILRIANSAAFYRGTEVYSVARAIVLLGEKLVAGIAIGACASSIFQHPLEGYESEAGGLWDHSLRTGIASREIAVRFCRGLSADLAFTAGLLHDIGKAILSEYLKGGTQEMARRCDDGGYADFITAEIERVGTDHAAVGHALAVHWGLPDAICTAVRYHHCPEEAKSDLRRLVYTVHLGDLLAMMGGSGTGADALSYRIDPNYETYIQVDQDDLFKLMIQVEEEFRSTKAAVFSE
jgi:putative nucleotidyltransferase with HDIG domain